MQIVSALFLLGFGTNSIAQDQYGVPFVRNYSSRDIKGSATIWGIAQTSDDVMHFGASETLFSFNGQSWSTYKFPSNTVRSLDKDHQGNLYVGLKKDFGLMEKDKEGELQFHSLLDKVPEEKKDFADIWNTHHTKYGTFYFAFNRCFWYNGESIKVFDAHFAAHLAFESNGELYAIFKKEGLKRFNGNDFELLPGGEQFIRQNLFMVCEQKKNQLMIFSKETGFWHLNLLTGEVKDFNPEREEELITNRVYHGIQIDKNLFVLATLGNGLYIMTGEGKIIGHFTTETGLLSDNIKYLYLDKTNSLWVGTAKGICYIDIKLPFAFYTPKEGLKGFPRHVAKLNNEVYVATGNGVYRYDRQETDFTQTFKLVDNLTVQAWEFAQAGGRNFIGTSDGLMELTGNHLKPIGRFNTVFVLHRSTRDPNLLYLGLVDGLAIARVTEQGIKLHQFKQIESQVDYMAEGPGGHLLFTPRLDSVLVIDPSSFEEPYELKMIKLPPDSGKSLTSIPSIIDNTPYIFKESGTYTMDAETGKLVKARELHIETDHIEPNITINSVFKYAKNKMWCIGVRENGESIVLSATLTDTNGYYAESYPGIRITEKIYNPRTLLILDDYMWIPGSEGLIRVELNKTGRMEKDFHVSIDAVYFQDSLVPSGMREQEYPHYHNSFKFTFAALDYQNPVKNEFQVILEGRENIWSDWFTTPYKEYSNLPDGQYTFKVRSRNVYGQLSQTKSYAFTVAPPWYFTWYAYTGYVLALLVFGFTISKVSTYRLKKTKLELEKKVHERTQIIAQEKQKLQVLHEQLEEKNKDVMDSIMYARRIQRSVLTPLDQLNQLIPDNFVYYQPRDIVSGDFYWYKHMNNVLIMAVADCTGHGVPGAFMSMISSTLINQIVSKSDINYPQDALSILDREIRATLHRGGEGGFSTTDGLDISLMVYHMDSGLLQYSGAKRPLYLFSDDSLQIYKGSFHSIGGAVENDKEFEGYEFHVKKGDCLYMFSDGYADQFGGEKDKKFKIKRLQKLLQEISREPMEKQHQVISSTFEDWKGNNEQVDDLLMVGLRIP